MYSRIEIIANLHTTWAALDSVLASLDSQQWRTQSLCPAWTVQGVAVHAASIEQALIGWKPGSESPFSAIGAIHAELAELAPEALVERFRSIVSQRQGELGEMTDDDFATPGVTPVGPGTYARFMSVRVFDNWVHERDIRVPLGLAGDDSGSAAEMSLDEVHNSLGFIVGKKIGLSDGKGLAIEVTGPIRRRMYVKV